MLRITRANTLEKNSLFGFASSGAWMDGGSRRLQHEYSEKKEYVAPCFHNYSLAKLV